MGEPARKFVSEPIEPAEDLDEERAEEIERRIRDTEGGGDQGTPWDVVRGRLKAKYGWS